MINYLDETSQILRDYTPTEAAALTADPVFQNIMSLEDLQGIPHEDMFKMRANLVDAYHQGIITQGQAEKYVSVFRELCTHNNVIGLGNAVDKMFRAKSESNIYGYGN